MRKLKRLRVNQLTTLQELSVEEMMQLFGGTNCCWNVMAEAYRRMYASEYANEKYRNNRCFTASYYQEKWAEYMGDETDESGDPKIGDSSKGQIDQSQDLYNFMKEYFFNTTTESGFESNGYSNMLTTSGAHNWGGEQLAFGIIDSGNGIDKHAVLMIGMSTDVDGTVLYTYWEPDSGNEYTASKGVFLCGTGLYRKE